MYCKTSYIFSLYILLKSLTRAGCHIIPKIMFETGLSLREYFLNSRDKLLLFTHDSDFFTITTPLLKRLAWIYSRWWATDHIWNAVTGKHQTYKITNQNTFCHRIPGFHTGELFQKLSTHRNPNQTGKARWNFLPRRTRQSFERSTIHDQAKPSHKLTNQSWATILIGEHNRRLTIYNKI